MKKYTDTIRHLVEYAINLPKGEAYANSMINGDWETFFKVLEKGLQYVEKEGKV